MSTWFSEGSCTENADREEESSGAISGKWRMIRLPLRPQARLIESQSWSLIAQFDKYLIAGLPICCAVFPPQQQQRRHGQRARINLVSERDRERRALVCSSSALIFFRFDLYSERVCIYHEIAHGTLEHFSLAKFYFDADGQEKRSTDIIIIKWRSWIHQASTGFFFLWFHLSFGVRSEV